MDDQNHYNITGEKVQGGQLLMVHDISPVNNVTVTRGGIVRDRKTGKYVQKVTITNNNANALDGSLVLVLDGLSVNATLANSAGVTAAYAPIGSPYITVSGSPLGCRQQGCLNILRQAGRALTLRPGCGRTGRGDEGRPQALVASIGVISPRASGIFHVRHRVE
jgi:hypothetical protein